MSILKNLFCDGKVFDLTKAKAAAKTYAQTSAEKKAVLAALRSEGYDITVASDAAKLTAEIQKATKESLDDIAAAEAQIAALQRQIAMSQQQVQQGNAEVSAISATVEDWSAGK